MLERELKCAMILFFSPFPPSSFLLLLVFEHIISIRLTHSASINSSPFGFFKFKSHILLLLSCCAGDDDVNVFELHHLHLHLRCDDVKLSAGHGSTEERILGRKETTSVKWPKVDTGHDSTTSCMVACANICWKIYEFFNFHTFFSNQS